MRWKFCRITIKKAESQKAWESAFFHEKQTTHLPKRIDASSSGSSSKVDRSSLLLMRPLL